jgi:glycosyltransferase involved in cell wall biosynthesis
VHFTAPAEQAEAEALGIPMRSAVVPLAVESDHEPDFAGLQARFPALGDAGYLLFLSRLDPKKNVETALDAFAQVANDFPAVKVAIVGDGPADYVAQLKSRAQQRGIGGRVVWTGFLDGPLKAAVLQRAGLFVLPSFSENFGIAAAEALLAGLPCVLGQGVAIAADVQRAGAGMAVPPEAGATAAAVRCYLSDRQRHALASAAARQFALAQYSVDAMGRNLRRLYEHVLLSHRASREGALT